MSEMCATPVYNVGGNDGIFGGCGGSYWILILFFLFAFGRGGFGGWGSMEGNFANGALTRAEMYDGFNTNQVFNGIRGLERGICDLGYSMQGGFNGIERDLCSGFANTNSAITNLGYQMQNCCCETNRNIDAVRYENAKNTCDITNAIHAEGEATRSLITQNTMQELRDQLQAAQLQLGNINQTNTLISALRPCPVPAYPSCSPYQSYSWSDACGFNGCCNR